MFFQPAVTMLLTVSVLMAAFSPVRGQDEPAEDQAATNAFREQTIYIPYDKLRRTFEKQGRGVFLPYEKFQDLWKAARATQPPVDEPVPPVKAVITEIDNDARVEDDVVRVTADVRIDLLGKEGDWIEVPLRLSDAALLSATIDGESALLVADRSGGQNLIVRQEKNGPRRIRLHLEYAKSISKTPGQNSVAFQAPLAPVNRWRIHIPESGVKVNVHPMLASTEVPPEQLVFAGGGAAGSQDDPAGGVDDVGRRPDEGGNTDGTVVLAFVGAAPTVRIDWNPKAEGASGLDALVSVQTQQTVTIDEGVTRTRCQLVYEISRAELPQLTIDVPADQKVVNVVDANVRQWNVEGGGETQTITVALFQPASQQQTVVVELEKFNEDPGGEIVVPTVAASGVGRQRGLVMVRVADGLRSEPIRRGGLLQLDASEVPETLRHQTWTFSYRYAALPFELALQVEKVQPRIDVDQLVEAFLEPQSLTLGLFAKYTIQRAGVFELQLDVPGGFDVLRVVGHKAAGAEPVTVDSHVLEDVADGTARLRVNLANKAQGTVGLLVELQRRLSDANLLSPTGQSSTIDLVPPRVATDSVQRSAGHLVVYAPESLRVRIPQQNGFRNISFEEAFAITASVRDGRFGGLRPVQALAFSDAAASAQLDVARRQPQVTVQQVLIARVDPGVVKYEATFLFDIRFSSVKSLRLDLPAELADQVHNETAALRETIAVPPPDDLADGYVAWILSGETELLGSVQCKLTWETPIDELDVGRSVDLAVPRIVPRDIERADGQIVIVKAETIDVQPKGQPRGLDPIDPRHDLIAGIQVSDAAGALEFHGDWDLTLTATRYQLEEVKHTSIEQAVLRMVMTRSGRVSVQSLYRMRSNRQRLEIQLPAEVAVDKIEFDTDPLRINGRRVTLERGDDSKTFFIPLVSIQANEPFVLELRYTASDGGGTLVYPMFPDEPAVQKVNLVAYVPQELAYLGKRGPWTDETVWVVDELLRRVPAPRNNVEQLIAQLTDGINVTGDPVKDFPTDGRPLLFSTLRPAAPDEGALRLTTLNSHWLNGMVFGLVAIAGVLLLRRTAVDRIVVICALVAALVIIGVFLPTLAAAVLNQNLAMAVVVVALLWLAVFSVRTLPKLRGIGFRSRRLMKEEVSPPPVAAADAAPPEQQRPENQANKEGGPSDAS